MHARPVGVFSAENRTSVNGIGTINHFTPDRQETEEINLCTTSESLTDFEDTDEKNLVDGLATNAINLFKANRLMFFSDLASGPQTKLITPDAGGNSVGSTFYINLLKIGGKKKLLLILERDDDPGTNTVCMFWIVCPRWIITEEFKNTVKKGVVELIYDGSYVLRDRAKLRRAYNELKTKFFHKN